MSTRALARSLGFRVIHAARDPYSGHYLIIQKAGKKHHICYRKAAQALSAIRRIHQTNPPPYRHTMAELQPNGSGRYKHTASPTFTGL